VTAATGPIFIGGLSSSGKTPLRIILSAHPDLALTRKTYLWDRYYGRYGDLSDAGALDRCLTALRADRALAALAPDLDAVGRELTAGPPTYARLFGAIHAQAAARCGKRRWGEQLGFVERYADPIFADFPDAAMIHMIRDPRDRMAAMFGTQRPRPGRCGWETAKWRRSAQLAARNQLHHPDGYRVVSYEALTDDTETTVGVLCEFIGEEYLSEIEDAARSFARECDAARAAMPPPFTGLPDRPGAADRLGITVWQLLERRRSARVGA
jgi:hypothetical protein